VAFITAIATMALMVADESLDEPRIRKPLERALAWLETTRNPDGGHREAISLNVWDTSLSALALMRVGVSPRSKEIRRLAEWLVEAQNHDGGWAFHSVRGSGLPSDADDTALATQTLLRSGRHPVQTERGIAWLLSHQGKDGSWATYVPEIGDVGCVSVTSNAIHTLLLINERVAVGRAVEWLCRSQANDGSWSDLWLAKRTYGTSKALVALAHVGVKDEVVRRGLALLASIRHEDGGWGETQLGNATASTVEQTAFVAQALRAHRQDASSAERLLLERQREDGGWTASPIGIYWEVIGGYANPINAWVFPMLALSEGSSESAR
ncbi:MAG: hypothetical protein O3A46_12160, partial [Candidatus Poribacteria bacterium]|nr:hypothetical protein [Candidatus Poribacteria bacterium]